MLEFVIKLKGFFILIFNFFRKTFLMYYTKAIKII